MVRTISAPPWAETTFQEPGRYKPPVNGKRVLGWADTNITLLASDLGVSYTYLLGILKGERNCTLGLLRKAAIALGLPVQELITRIERSYELNARKLA